MFCRVKLRLKKLSMTIIQNIVFICVKDTEKMVKSKVKIY